MSYFLQSKYVIPLSLSGSVPKFTHGQIEQIIQSLSDVLANRNPDVKLCQ